VRTNYIVVGIKLYGCENKNLWLWEQIYGCMNKNIWLWEQNPMAVGTKLFFREKIYGWGKKSKVVGTNLW
jgi:hypothetical protein